MSYVRGTSVWHVVLPGKKVTLCGRPVPKGERRRELPPLEVYLCRVCAGVA